MTKIILVKIILQNHTNHKNLRASYESTPDYQARWIVSGGRFEGSQRSRAFHLACHQTNTFGATHTHDLMCDRRSGWIISEAVCNLDLVRHGLCAYLIISLSSSLPGRGQPAATFRTHTHTNRLPWRPQKSAKCNLHIHSPKIHSPKFNTNRLRNRNHNSCEPENSLLVEKKKTVKTISARRTSRREHA